MSPPQPPRLVPTSTHWGPYEAEVIGERVVSMRPTAIDPDPSPMGQSFASTLYCATRILQPMVRAGYLDEGPGAGSAARRGAEPFVPVSWSQALDLVAEELRRVREQHGNRAIFAGSYGWGTAGRFHHAPYQLHRFMNLHGGFTTSVNAYSYAAGEVILPRVVADFFWIQYNCTTWPVIARHSELIVMFGGMPLKNAQVGHGGPGRHTTKEWLRRCREGGAEFVNISPLRDDADEFLAPQWLSIRPNTDVALMLGLAHTLVEDGLHDRAFLDRYCVGFERFSRYLVGATDGRPKSAEWAAAITGLNAEAIRGLARKMAKRRTMINVSWSLQRADHGEQPYWMAVTLAAMLGQIGLPGGGFGVGYSAVNDIGNPASRLRWAYLPEGKNPLGSFIPVARIADMLLNPGETIDYDGRRLTYPDIRLIYWAGGNPFHHHQDLNRLVTAWRRPDTVIVHEPWWNANARHADIVLPSTTTVERNDISFNPRDGFVIPMHQAIPPVGQARNDHDIFVGLAERLGLAREFTEGRTEMEWLRHLYAISREGARAQGVELPGFDAFWIGGPLQLPPVEDRVLLDAFRADPEANRLKTPSGKIEIFSEVIDGFGYDDCPGHPTWLEPVEWLGAGLAKKYPLHLLSNQPKTRLHGQLDNGPYSAASKIAGREPARIHPQTAAKRGIHDGDVVRIFNDRGACLAGAVLSEDVRPDVVQLATGAWYDPARPGEVGALCRHGNPNVLTLDKGTSRLAQGPASHSALVEIERHDGPLEEVGVFVPPPLASR